MHLEESMHYLLQSMHGDLTLLLTHDQISIDTLVQLGVACCSPAMSVTCHSGTHQCLPQRMVFASARSTATQH